MDIKNENNITNDNLLQILDNLSIAKYSVSKRLQKECELLLHHGATIEEIYCDNDKNIVIKITKNNIPYNFTLAQDYPFRPPSVTIHGITLEELTIAHHTKNKCCHNEKCDLCNTFLCKANWTPVIMLHHMVKMLEEFKFIYNGKNL